MQTNKTGEVRPRACVVYMPAITVMRVVCWNLNDKGTELGKVKEDNTSGRRKWKQG